MPTIAQRQRRQLGVVHADITTARTGAYYAAAGAQRIAADVVTGPIAATKKVTVQLLQATDGAGAGAKPLGAPVEKVAPAGGGALLVTAEAKTEQLDDGYSYVAVQISSDNAGAVIGTAVLLFGDNRYNP
ncbi:hypothetical protein [Methylobacterium nodulans]|uniref:DCL3 dicer-like protein n=1 Tax=Methylobacterium nodulans (strain LMG 21967 / CNCM I-2342 / ORS 2060) TaxID=460265 RepID=B8ITA0_METNO|nr:hypothetical protein [Methylobacterium nodulans]ACL56986.1 DCL3; dicer-like protein [Methylobacterium nodulans ORS 2060]